MISLISPSEVKNPTSIAIGSFDGLHAGHRQLIKSVVEENQYTPTIASFWPHPREVLYKETRLRLDLPYEKLSILEDLGIEQLVLIPFDKELSKLSAERFVRDILINQLQAKNISVGANFKFGFRRSGDINTIKNIIKDTDIKLKISPILEDKKGRISSSRIRDLLEKSDLKNALKILKRPYSFNGKVVRGKGIGKRIGWPTANLEIDGRKFLPGEGVYASWTTIENSNQKIESIMNLGSQPTINPLLPSTVEVHLINKDIDLYGFNLSIEPVKKLRSQIKFKNIDQLSNQIKKDRDNALKILKTTKNKLQMLNSNNKDPEDLRIYQIIDANLDRAREGLRVLEDWARFGLGKEKYVEKIKNFRQILGKNHLEVYKQSRNYIEDRCKGLTHQEQINRKTSEQIISSNAGRVQEALRVIEEFSRLQNHELSKIASEIRYEIYTLEIEILSLSKRKNSGEILKENDLYVITDQKENLLEIIEEILIAGVKIIQHRFKTGTDKDNLQEAIQIKSLCKKYNSLFIINDRVDIALASNADGIHLGQEDFDIKLARKLLGYSKIIGVSANNEIDISKALKDGCDYIGIGPVYKTSTKKNKKPIGIEKIKTLTKDLNIPWFAIGGIKTNNISYLKRNGLKKVALVSQLMNSEDPKEDAIMILKELSHEN